MKRILSVVCGVVIGILSGWGVAAYASRSTTGTYTLPSGNPVVTNTTITSTWANNTLSDIGTEITGSLSRNGYGGMLSQLRGVSGSVSAPAFSFTSDTNTGIYRAGADDLRMTVGGADATATAAAAVAITSGKVFSVSRLSIYDDITSESGNLSIETPVTLWGTLTAVSSTNSSFIPGVTYTGTPTSYSLYARGQHGTTGGSTGMLAVGGDATVSGQGGIGLKATGGDSITGGADAISATGTDTGYGIRATSETGAAGIFTAGGVGYNAAVFTSATTTTPTVGQIKLTPTTNVPSAANDGDLYFKASGPFGWKANSVKFAAYKGTCVLGTSCSAIAVSEATYCVCSDATSAAACKSLMASSPPTSTVTFTGTGTDTLYYICL